MVNDSGGGPRIERRSADQTGARRSLAQGARWFAAEFLVVVCGVLVALALNAYYQGRVEAQREAGYIQQLAADLRESEAVLERALAGNEAERAKLMQLLALFSREEAPSLEAFRELTTFSIRPVQPTLSTAQAVVETGDLNLISDDSLRSAIIQYVGAGESYNETQDAVAWEWLTPSIRDFYEIVPPGAGPRHPFAISPTEALSQKALYHTVFDLQLGLSNHIRLQQDMLDHVRGMQGQIERVLGEP